MTTTLSVDPDAAILRAADDLFYERGVAAVTMADIRDTSGVSMRRLYSLYPSKSDLVTGWLTQRHEDWTRQLHAQIDAALDSGVAPLDALFDSIESWLTVTSFRGCGFLNTFAERSELTLAQHEIIRTHKSELARYLQRLVPHVPGLAVLIDGAIVQSALFADLAPLHAAHQLATSLTTTSPTSRNAP